MLFPRSSIAPLCGAGVVRRPAHVRGGRGRRAVDVRRGGCHEPSLSSGISTHALSLIHPLQFSLGWVACRWARSSGRGRTSATPWRKSPAASSRSQPSSALARASCRSEHTGVAANAKVANRDVRGFGWEIAHAAVSRRPPTSLSRIVARTEGYTYAVND
jgi:hypothetical protein